MKKKEKVVLCDSREYVEYASGYWMGYCSECPDHGRLCEDCGKCSNCCTCGSEVSPHRTAFEDIFQVEESVMT